jgi:hypothetical protein
MAIKVVVQLVLDHPYLQRVNQKNFHVHDQLSQQTTTKEKQEKFIFREIREILYHIVHEYMQLQYHQLNDQYLKNHLF